MLLRSPTSSSPWAPWNLRLLAPLLPRPLLCSYVHLTTPVPRCRFYPLLASPPKAPAGGRKRSIRAGGAAGARLLLPDARRDWRTLSARWKGRRKSEQNTIFSPLPVWAPPTLTMFRVLQESPQQQLWSPPPLGSAVFLLLALVFCFVLDRPLSVPPAGKRSWSRRENWLSDSATLTDPRHVTALSVGLLTWPGRVAFIGFGWNLNIYKKVPLTIQH